MCPVRVKTRKHHGEHMFSGLALSALSFADTLAHLDAIRAATLRKAASGELVDIKNAVTITGLGDDTLRRRLKADPSLGQRIGKKWFINLRALIEAEAG